MLCCLFQEICHRDLKLENTLLDGKPSPRLKICDFGYSKVNSIHVQDAFLNISHAYHYYIIFCAHICFLLFFLTFLSISTCNCSLLYCILNLNQQLELLHTLLQRFCHERSMMGRYWDFLLFSWGTWKYQVTTNGN